MSRRGFGHETCKAVGKGFDDPQCGKFHRILSQTQRSELHSVESGLLSLRPAGESRLLCMGIVTQIEDLDNSSTSTPRDIEDQCSRGFAFPADFLILSGLQPAGLQHGGEAPVWQVEKITSGNFRKFPVFFLAEMSYLHF